MTMYIGTKLINAHAMTRLEYNEFRGWEVPEDENPADEGYLVEYLDGGTANTKQYSGYVSWSPKEVFERAYRNTDAMTFGDALTFLKQGAKLARKGWNGKNMFIYRVGENSYPAQTKAARDQFGEMVPYKAYYAMKTVDNEVVPWLCSITDMDAEDWYLVK